jgi:hypothetical protein
VTAIWESNATGTWRLLAPSRYPAEAALHDLVEQAPQMLPLAGSPRITVLGREVQLGTGRADLLAVESSGSSSIRSTGTLTTASTSTAAPGAAPRGRVPAEPTNMLREASSAANAGSYAGAALVRPAMRRASPQPTGR